MQSGLCLLRIWAVAILFGAMTTAAWPALVAAQAVPDEILQAWRRRQDLVKTVRFTFASDGEERRGKSSPLIAYQIPNDFALSEDGWRHESHTLDGREFVSTFDGRQGMRMFGTSQVSILPGPINSDIRNRELQPIVLWLRPLDGRFHDGVDLAECELVSDNELVDERRCIQLRAPSERSNTNSKKLLFVDPIRDYVVVRRTSEVNGRRSTQIDITYTEDRNVGWVPTNWKTIWWSDTGEVMSTYSSTVENYSINEKLSEKLFVIDPQPGALLIDQATDITYRIGEDGERQVVPRQTLPAATKPALPLPSASEWKRAKLWNDRMARGCVFVVIGALIFLCIAAVVRFRRRTT